MLLSFARIFATIYALSVVLLDSFNPNTQTSLYQVNSTENQTPSDTKNLNTEIIYLNRDTSCLHWSKMLHSPESSQSIKYVGPISYYQIVQHPFELRQDSLLSLKGVESMERIV